ncbi:MAG: hypothetical protein KY429_01285 [Actinobacteria bacterium]|nr:hypothetical protein [Actinomycetota bacterium]
MTRLLLVEVRRFFARDIVRLFGLILVGGIVLITIGSFLSSLPMTPAEAAEADEQIRANRTDMEEQILQCRNPPPATEQIEMMEQQGMPPEFIERMRIDAERDRTRRECLDQLQTSVNGRLIFARTYPSNIQLAIFPMALMSLAIGATLIGAEWTTGTVTTQLTWEPRRLRLFSVKALVAALGVLATFVALQALMAVSLLPGTLLRGTFAGIDRWWWEHYLDIVWRGGAVLAIACLLGFGVSGLIRNTVAAVGGLFAYLLIVENILRAVTQDLRQWLITNNLLVAVLPDGSRIIPERSAEEALLLLSAYVFGILVLSGFLFWRRDVAG